MDGYITGCLKNLIKQNAMFLTIMIFKNSVRKISKNNNFNLITASEILWYIKSFILKVFFSNLFLLYLCLKTWLIHHALDKVDFGPF